MRLLDFLGLGDRSGVDSNDTETVRRIAGELERLPPEKARYLAAFAYVLARLANADLEIDASETEEMERIVGELAGLAPFRVDPGGRDREAPGAYPGRHPGLRRDAAVPGALHPRAARRAAALSLCGGGGRRHDLHGGERRDRQDRRRAGLHARPSPTVSGAATATSSRNSRSSRLSAPGRVPTLRPRSAAYEEQCMGIQGDVELREIGIVVILECPQADDVLPSGSSARITLIRSSTAWTGSGSTATRSSCAGGLQPDLGVQLAGERLQIHRLAARHRGQIVPPRG